MNCKICNKKIGAKATSLMCAKCYGREYRRIHKKRIRTKRIGYYQAHKKHLNELAARRNATLKNILIEKLGGKCACCGETQREFLTLDHIKRGGNKEYKSIGSMKMYAKVKREGYPKDKYRILCWNCNACLGMYGYCPHSNLTSPTYHSSKNHVFWIKELSK